MALETRQDARDNHIDRLPEDTGDHLRRKCEEQDGGKQTSNAKSGVSQRRPKAKNTDDHVKLSPDFESADRGVSHPLAGTQCESQDDRCGGRDAKSEPPGSATRSRLRGNEIRTRDRRRRDGKKEKRNPDESSRSRLDALFGIQRADFVGL